MKKLSGIAVILLSLFSMAATNTVEKIVIKGSNTFGEELGPKRIRGPRPCLQGGERLTGRQRLIQPGDGTGEIEALVARGGALFPVLDQVRLRPSVFRGGGRQLAGEPVCLG